MHSPPSQREQAFCQQRLMFTLQSSPYQHLNDSVMPSVSAESDSIGHVPISLTPSEIAICIFSQLSTFFDVLALSSICHSLRNTWLGNVTPIYKNVAPRSIECELAARVLLADQGGPSVESPLCARDVVHMVGNDMAAKNAMLVLSENLSSMWTVHLVSQAI